MSEIYLAGGCFWGVQKAISLLDGVLETECGYANGDPHFRPDYMLVCSGKYGYAETVKVTFDQRVLSLERLLKAFFMIIDPTQLNRQGHDIGIQYRTGVYWTDDDVGEGVRRIIDRISGSIEPFYTECMPLSCYVPAEEYHQDYLDKNPEGYCHISEELMGEIRRIVRE